MFAFIKKKVCNEESTKPPVKVKNEIKYFEGCIYTEESNRNHDCGNNMVKPLKVS
jgi:nitrous oxidase accessory protein NosD